MSRLRDLAEATAALLVSALMIAAFLAIIAGGMFYRSACPSKVEWSFNPVPFVQTVDMDVARGEAIACRKDTATSYYAGKVPLVGGPLRGFIKGVTGQDG